MKTYRIEVSTQAQDAIDGCSYYIEDESGSAEIARRWLRRVYEALATLQYMPDRYDTAAEGRSLDYEVRRLLVGDYLALYCVDEAAQVVHILNVRHGSRLPRPSDLPGKPPR